MRLDHLQDHQIFLHCSITCIYYFGILTYLCISDKLHNIGTYKLIFILSTLVFVELLKLFFTIRQLNNLSVNKLDLNNLTKSKKNLIKTVKLIIKFVSAIIGITLIYHVTIILYGAPLFINCKKTLMLALTLTTLTLIPASLHLGIDNALSLFIYSQLSMKGKFIDIVKLNIKTVLLATWLSAFVLPLDWDRPWQVWPTPCIMGAFLGYFIAHFITILNIFMIKFRKKYKKNETLKIC